jgi:hypothetical protein
MNMSPPDVEMGQLANKLVWNEKWIDSGSLVTCDSYHLTRKNSSFDLDNKMLPNPRGKRIEGRYCDPSKLQNEPVIARRSAPVGRAKIYGHGLVGSG